MPELLGKHATDVLARTGSVQPGQSLRIETYMHRKDGSYTPIEAVTIRLKNGNLQSVVRDISERKKAEAARAEIEKRYTELVEQSLEGITVRKPDGEFVFVNETFCRLLGYTRDQLLNMNIRDLVHPEDAETIAQVQDLKGGGSLHLEKRMHHKDGHLVYVEVSARRLADGNFQSTFQDITERKRSEQLIHAAEERYRAAIGALAEGIAILDADGRVVAHNDSGTRILGLTPDEFTGRMVMDPNWSLENEDGTPFDMSRHPVVITLASGRDVDNVILGLARPDGSHRLLTVNSRGLALDASGKPTSVLASFRDITEQRHSEQALRAYAEELRLLSQRLLEAQETERRAIARELHDEVGQALTAARMNLKELERQVGDSPLAKQAADASAIVAQLLQQVRQLSLDMHPTVLDDLGLAASLRWLVRTRAGNELNVTLDLAEDLPRFTSTVEHTLFRVFQEALSNALRHSGARNLWVKLELKEGKLHLEVRDDGHGFDAEAARKHALSGASLGVIGMQERARLAGGRVVIESTLGKGTQIRVSLSATELQE